MKLNYFEVKSLLIAGVCFGIKRIDFIKYVNCLSGRELSNIKRVKEFRKLNDFFQGFLIMSSPELINECDCDPAFTKCFNCPDIYRCVVKHWTSNDYYNYLWNNKRLDSDRRFLDRAFEEFSK